MIRRLHKDEEGQAMVEFALVLPILLMVLCAIIDFGWLYYNSISLKNAAREGARYAVIHYEPGTTWKDDATNRMMASMVGVDNAVAIVSDPVGQQITAQVSSDTPLLTGFLSTIMGRNSITLHASCVMRLEN
ncbi:MAG: pilus assembly protein [Erysipelotrichaceae bacterium]|nr:pilus assembly protein [Erysipelotrichaceae bacterium]